MSRRAVGCMSNPSGSAVRRGRPFVTAALLGLMGFYFLIGGGILILTGGNGFYAALGAAYLMQSSLAWRRSPYLLIAAAATLGLVILWSLLDVGLDIWGLEVRLLVPML